MHVVQVLKRFPDKDTKILVACSNGKKYSLDALGALDEEGYTHIVGLKVPYPLFLQLHVTCMRVPDQSTPKCG